MISGQSQATLRRPQRRDSTSSEHDAATLSASLRDLAIRAHRLIRGGPGSGWGRTLETTAELSSEAEQALTEVHADHTASTKAPCTKPARTRRFRLRPATKSRGAVGLS